MDTQTLKDTKQTVLSFLEALNKDDFQTARKYVTEDLKFIGVLGTREGADSYFKDMERLRLKYNIKKIFADGDDVSVFYEINMSGTAVFSAGWYHLEQGKIKWFQVVFDPRPVLQ